MNTIEIPDLKQSVSFPSCWDECSMQQTQQLMQWVWLAVTRRMSPLELHIRAFYYLTGIKRDWISVFWEKLHPLETVSLHAKIATLAEQTLGFLMDEHDGELLPCYHSVKNPLPHVTVGRWRNKTILYGPADMLTDLTFGEYKNALAALSRYTKEQNTEYLDELITYLYRRLGKPNKAGRRVVDVDNSNFAAELALTRKMAAWQKQLILLWFAHCVSFIQTSVIPIGAEEVNMPELFPKREGGASGVNFSLDDLAISVAEEHTFGTLEDVEREHLFVVFLKMWSNLKKHKDYDYRSKQKK